MSGPITRFAAIKVTLFTIEDFGIFRHFFCYPKMVTEKMPGDFAEFFYGNNTELKFRYLLHFNHNSFFPKI
jgi:hypothetical protein